MPSSPSAETRTQRLNAMLRGIRKVNRMLTRERDPQALIRQACEQLVEQVGLSTCAVVLTHGGWAGMHAVAGVPDARHLDEILRAGKMPQCMRLSLETGATTLRQKGEEACKACEAFDPVTSDHTSVALPLRVDEVTYGAMLITLAPGDEGDAEDCELLVDLCGDMATALRAIEVEAQRAAAAGDLLREREELRATRDRLDAIIRAAPAAVLSLDAEGVVLSWNPAAERMFGYTAEETVGQPLPIVPPTKQSESRSLISAVASGAALAGVEVQRVKKDGSPIELSVSTAPLRGPDGRITAIMAVTVDITEKKRTARALQESQRKLETLMGNLPGMAYRCANDPVWTMEFVSEGSVAVTGYRPSQLTGVTDSPFGTLIHPADRERLWNEVQEALRENRPFVLEYRIHDIAGTEKWVWEQGLGVRAEDGSVMAIEGFILDITANKRAEEAAKLGEARLASLLELGQKKFSSEKELIDYALEEAVRLTGSRIGYFHLVEPDQMTLQSYSWSQEAVKNCVVPELTHYPLDSAGIWADCARYKCPIVHEDYQNLPDKKGYPAGHAHIVRHMSAPIVADGVVMAVAGVANKASPYDETDVRQLQLFLDGLWKVLRQKREQAQRALLEEQLRLAQKMDAIGRLAGGIAHDFNNMIAAMIGYTELVLDDVPESDPHHNDLIEIRKAGERAATLTRQLLAFARGQVLTPEVLSLNHVVVELERMLRRLIGEDIELFASLDANLGLAEFDRAQLEQVLVNLALNSRDAMPSGGRLTIETANMDVVGGEVSAPVGLAPGRYVTVAVIDTGVGMDEATRARLFEPFFTTKGEGRGTGLGLATVYGIISQSRGRIWVASEVGKGSTFRIFLPRVAGDLDSHRIAKPSDACARGAETILVVEDEEAVRGISERILSTAGYQVLLASSGPEALRLCERFQGTVDLMLADVVMPQMSGRELADRLAGLRPGMRVLYMSGHAEEAIAHHGVYADRGHFISKPFNAVDLTRKVRELLDDD